MPPADVLARPTSSKLTVRDAAPRPFSRRRTRAALDPAAGAPTGARDTVVEFKRVSKHYSAGDTGLERATFAVQRQEFVFLVGATGSGKSTVMRLLIKELEPTEGAIHVAGRDLSEIDRKKVPYYRRNVGVVFQDFKLLPTRTVYDNVAYALQVTGASRKRIRATLPDILRLTGLSTKLHNYPHQLSGGEQQRVAVARAFAGHPPLLLADEPTGNLDPETSIGIMQLLYRINRAGTTVLVATHDSDMVDRMRRRVIELKRGRIIRDEAGGSYGAREESTSELGERLRQAPARRSSASAGRPPARGLRTVRRDRAARRTDAARVLPQGGDALDASQRGAELRRAGFDPRHDARARRVHPGRAGDQRRRQRHPRPGAGRCLHGHQRDRRRSTRVRSELARAPHVGTVQFDLQAAGVRRSSASSTPRRSS